MNNIYLVGMMGSGKSSSGEELARLLAFSFVDLDERIEERVGMSINEIFETYGESFFRKVESEVLSEVARNRDQVVASGGGVVLSPSNRETMRRSGSAIYLKTSLDALWERVKHKRDRPLLEAPDPKQVLANLLRIRGPLYEEVAMIQFVTNGKSPQAVALEIYQRCFKTS